MGSAEHLDVPVNPTAAIVADIADYRAMCISCGDIVSRVDQPGATDLVA